MEHNNVTYILHHTDMSKSSGNVTIEEQYAIEGFTYKEGTAIGQSYNNAKFYYTRHKYAIEFYSPTELLRKEENIYFAAPIGRYDWTPENTQAPAIYEPGSVTFEGWYLNPDCTEKFVFINDETNEEAKMPAGEKDGDTTLTLYAKWIPVNHTVNFYMDRNSLEAKKTIPVEMDERVQAALDAGTITERPANDPYTSHFAQMTVQHGKYIGAKGSPGVTPGYEKIHPKVGYDFIEWFYIENGDEVAFNPEKMPVDRDLDLFAKWNSDVLCKYTVYFALDKNRDGKPDTDENDNIIYVADPISGSGLAGHTFTFAAAGGEQLYDDYDDGYFPHVGSHSITIDISDPDGTGANTFTFLYQEKNAVEYTVEYRDVATGNVVAPTKVVSNNRMVVVTENFVFVEDYLPDAYQKTLVVVEGNENKIVFWYTKDEVHAMYVVNYYIQNLKDDLSHAGWSKYSSYEEVGNIGAEISADALTIGGFTLSADYTNGYNTGTPPINGATNTALPGPVGTLENGKLKGTLTERGMELNFYYTRDLYPYEFRYMLMGTAVELADPDVGKAPYDDVVTKAYKEIVADIDGDGVNEDYRLYDPNEKTKSIHIVIDGDPLNDASVVFIRPSCNG